MTTDQAPPAYSKGETARAVYLLARGAVAAMVGRDPASTKWDGKLGQLAAMASERGEPTS